jgi:hypothetical protein
MNCDTTTSPYKYLRVKNMGKKSNAINLYYLNFLGTVMLRPLLVILDGCVWDGSSPTIPLPPAVHPSTRFLLNIDFFQVVLLLLWDCYTEFKVVTVKMTSIQESRRLAFCSATKVLIAYSSYSFYWFFSACS